MALPTGDDQTIIWRLVVESQKAVQDVQKFREQVDALKQYLKQMSAETGASFDSISKSLGISLKKGVDEAKASLKSLEDALKKAKQEATGKDLGGNIISPTKVAEAKAALATLPPEIEKQQLALAKASAAYTTYKNTASTALKEVKQEATNAAKAAGELGGKVGTATKSVGGFASALGGVNELARVFFGVTLLSIGVQALRSIVDWLSKAGQAALQFSKAMFQLEVGVRALRRSGIDITTEEILTNLQKINASVGNLFSNLELVTGAAEFTNLIRDLGLTADQIFSLQEAVVKLAVVNGRAMDDVQRTVALALSSGYTEGLQRLGVSINRLTIAEEANRLGFKGGYTALSEQARSQATYSLLVQKTAKYSDDLSEAQKRLFGELQSNQAQIENVKAAIGDSLLPFQLLWNKALLALIKIIPKILPIVTAFQSLGTMITAFKVLPAVWENAAKGAKPFADTIAAIGRGFAILGKAISESSFVKTIVSVFGGLAKSIRDVFSSIGKSLEKTFGPIFAPIKKVFDDAKQLVANTFGEISRTVANSPFGKFVATVVEDFTELINKMQTVLVFMKKINDARMAGESLQPIISEFAGFGEDIPLGEKVNTEGMDKLMGTLEEFGKEVADLDASMGEKRKELEADLQADLADIAEKGKEKREDIWQDYWDDLAKIDREGARREAELLTDYQKNLKDIDIKLGFNISEAESKFDFDVTETAVKLNEDIAKANEDFRQKEAERERKYNEDLLRLREDYLVDIEEALSNRDAKAVLRARKELTLAKDRAARENEFDKIKNREGLAEDIRDAQLRREARIRELQFELEQRRLELERQAQFDRQAAWANYQADLDALRESIKQEKIERALARDEDLRDQLTDEERDVKHREAKYKAEIKELETFYADKLKLLGDHLQQQAALLGLSNEEVMRVIEAYFGDGGLALTVYSSFLKSVEAMIAAFKTSISGVDPNKFVLPFTTNTSKPPGFATGGAVIAKKPTDVTFGEVPEVAIFSPLSEISKLPSLLGGLVGSGGDGRVRIGIALSPELVGQIIEDTTNGIADVMFEVQRQ